LQARGASGCVLLGNPRFYGRFGFKPEPGLILEGYPPEYFQALSFGSAVPQGLVNYHAAFDAKS
jgi:putative acetyltransferase